MVVTQYECAECKDRGFIILLTSVVECECRAHDDVPKVTVPIWSKAYDDYTEYVATYG